jgi:hypothetical protein
MTNTANTANTDFRDERQGASFTEHLVFVALLLPTLIVLAAAVVSFATPEPTIAPERPMVTAAACEPCSGQVGADGP